jgi:hypothetical protein
MDTKQNSNSITIITMTDATDTKNALSFSPNFKKQISVEPEVLSENLKTFLKAFDSILDDKSTPAPKGFSIDEIELSLAVNASGGIELIGKADVGIEGGIKITLKRNKENDAK